MPALSELINKAKNFAVPLRLLGVNLDDAKIHHAFVPDVDALDRALDHMDDLATAPGAECALLEIEIAGKRAVALVVFAAPAIEGTALPLPLESRALPPAEKSP